MAGRIRASDIDEVKSRTNIADIVGEQVTLKSAGIGSLKGLCPFHDERSPSFHVRTSPGYYHCFGCGESGDVYSFLQKTTHVTFTEAVERLAERIGYALTYEEGGSQSDRGVNRSRLIAANAAAEKFYRDRLAQPDAEPGRTFLGQRGFDRAAADRFGIGYAPKGWSELRDHLRKTGFSDEESLAAGLLSQGEKGVYDRFRGRVVWPIRDVSGATLGFGARKLFDDDNGPKYLNTPDTPIYHKNQVLYGLDLAKKDIASKHQVVVVEGYTDVMAAHLSGVTTAVATCGTAFGVEHIKLIRRIMGDDSSLGEVVFTFDPDAAGQKAAIRAFSEQQRFSAQTFVAVGPDGLDPCDLRLQKGEQAVRDMISTKSPMFEFVMKTLIANINLNTVEGRAAALRQAAPVVAEIRDGSLKPGYTRELARLVGVDIAEATVAVQRAERSLSSSSTVEESSTQLQDSSSDEQMSISFQSLGSDPLTRLERDALSAVLQQATHVRPELIDQVCRIEYSQPALRAIANAVSLHINDVGTAQWLPAVLADTPEVLASLFTQLAVAPLPEDVPARIPVYVNGVVRSAIERDLVRRKAETMSKLQRLDSEDGATARVLQQELLELEQHRRSLRDE